MKKNSLTFLIAVLLGLVIGALVGQFLATVPSLAFLTKAVELSWQPKADLYVLKYDLYLEVKLNLISVAGIVAAIWVYRKL